jgi:hypothetical protein
MNTANGPRLGRQDKEATPLPQPRPDAKLPQRRRRGKTGGRDFVKGQNSHNGEVFRRTEDQLPRGNGTLMLKIAFHDFRMRIYESLAGSSTRPLAHWRSWTATSTAPRAGRPRRSRRPSGASRSSSSRPRTETEIPALPEPQKVGGGATLAAASAEDQVILGLMPVRM